MTQLTKLALRATVVAGAIAMTFAVATAYGAAIPGAATIVEYGFEGPSDTFPNNVALYTSPLSPSPGKAYWGPITQDKYAGSSSFWCAGTNLQTGGASNFWPKYPAGTRGKAYVRLPQLADYYASFASFYYKMPSLGGRDHFEVVSNQYDDSGVLLSTAAYQFLDDTRPSWTKVTVGLSSATLPTERRLSRHAGDVGIWFVDTEYAEVYPEAPNGMGPLVDDFAVLGYKFGPVRNLMGSYLSGSRVALSWSAPYASIDSTTVESRPIAYRVWRAKQGSESWTELTSSGARLTSPHYTDTISGASGYVYAVQAWDSGTGAGRGSYTTFPKAVTLTTPKPPTTMKLNKTYQVSGTIRPRHTSGSSIKVYAYRWDGRKYAYVKAIAVVLSNTGQPADTSKYTASVKLTKKGSWKLRTKHSAHGNEGTKYSSYSSRITVK